MPKALPISASVTTFVRPINRPGFSVPLPPKGGCAGTSEKAREIKGFVDHLPTTCPQNRLFPPVWYDSPMKSTDSTLKPLIEAGNEAVKSAAKRRAHLRRRTRTADKHRRMLLEAELASLRAAMVPLRSYLGRIAYISVSEKTEAQLRATSKSIQAESQKLKKMLGLVPWN